MVDTPKKDEEQLLVTEEADDATLLVEVPVHDGDEEVLQE